MTRKCIACKKELPGNAKLPLCEFHKGVAAEKVKQAGMGVGAVVAGVALMAKDKVIPAMKENVLPIANDAIKSVLKR